ncbi:hypothetical protein [Mycobacterium stomatepiae]|uniref:hypothetical protein n=1 Tax=Mycobacterium stomatepiae TaxID=470076 RepID=UPI0013D035A0|nr:hypothetical protein [Mycobacterium stomatepiae]MCV7164087.1 hypothetical protein [Mycobacterium stomatepiae]
MASTRATVAGEIQIVPTPIETTIDATVAANISDVSAQGGTLAHAAGARSSP